LKKALLAMAEKSYILINMEEQQGAHPRIGSQDTIPIYPFHNTTLEECRILAEEIGEEIYQTFDVPVYFSGVNARNDQRKALAYIRKGQYEGLKKMVHTDERSPDIGSPRLHPTAGATIVSADIEWITAYNVFLATENIDIAKKIAKTVRGPSGGFQSVRAVGLHFPERPGVVVSMNLLDCKKTPLYRVFNLIQNEAKRYGVAITDSELVGPIRMSYLLDSVQYFLGLEGFRTEQILESHLMEGETNF